MLNESKSELKKRVRTRLSEMLEQGYDKAKIYSKVELYENNLIVEISESSRDRYTVRYCNDCKGFTLFFQAVCHVCSSKRNKHKHECPNCGYKEVNSCPPNRWTCPKCKIMPNPQKCKHKCIVCGYEWENNSPIAGICPKCGNKSQLNTYHHKCQSCGFEEENTSPVNVWVCPNCRDKSNLTVYHHRCKECGFEEDNNCPDNVWSCPECGSQENRKRIHTCPVCNYKWENYALLPGICPNCGDRSQLTVYHHKCENCCYEETNNIPMHRWICPKCKSKSNLSKYHFICVSCGYEDYSYQPANRKCPQCGDKSQLNIYHHKCDECGFEEEDTCPDNVWVCSKCGWVPENYILGFNREEFYKKKLNLIKLDSIEEPVSLKDIDSLIGLCGVWAIYTVDGVCLDVCKTIDIGSEMLRAIRVYDRVVNGKYDNMNRRHRKFKQHNKEVETSSGEHLVFKLVATDISEEEALLIEAQYAHNNKALHWSPEPGQRI